MFSYLFLAISSVFFSVNSPVPGTADCDVLLEAIKGTYEGDCRKGLAHGEGKAVGTDTYEGEFKKGLPHGEGTYTWASGDVFVGEFNKGLKEGEGVLTQADGTVVKGYWKDDEYIGTDKNPYKIISKSVSVNRVMFRRQDASPDEIDFKFSYLGKPARARNFRVEGSFGVLTNETDYIKTVKVYQYPAQGTISFSTETTRDAGGSGSGDYKDGTLEFLISQSGKWEVTVEMQGQ